MSNFYVQWFELFLAFASVLIQLRMFCYALREPFFHYSFLYWLCDSQTCLSVNHWHSIRDSESKSSTLRSNDATSTRTPLKKWICVLSVFIAIVPTHWLCQIQANPTGAEFLGTIFKFRKRNQFRRCLFTQSIKVMLRETIRNDDFCDNTTLQCWENVVGIRNNVATMLQCCVTLRIVVATSP